MSAADIGHDEAGRDRVHRDAIRRQLKCHTLYEMERAGLGRHVRRADGRFHLVRGKRRRDDDAPGALRAHMASRSPERSEHTVEVHIDDAIPTLIGVILQCPLGHALAIAPHPAVNEAGARINPGIGEYHVQPAIERGSRIDRRIQGGMIGDINRRTADIVAGRSQARGLFSGLGRIQIQDGDPGAVLCQSFGVRQTQSAGAPR